MSRTELYMIDKKGNLALFDEFGNSHRGAALLWSNLCDKYLHDESYWLLSENKDKLWRLDVDKRVPRELRILFISTFDHMIIKKENLHLFIDAIEKCLKERHFDDFGHFESYPDSLRDVLSLNVLGIAWNQTSVNSGVWDVYESCPTCNHDTIQRGYNILKDTDHQFLFEYMEGRENDNIPYEE